MSGQQKKFSTSLKEVFSNSMAVKSQHDAGDISGIIRSTIIFKQYLGTYVKNSILSCKFRRKAIIFSVRGPLG